MKLTIFTATALAVLALPSSVLATGELAQKPGRAGCVSSSHRRSAASCQRDRALTQANEVAISPDGRNAYVVGYGSDSVSVFDRDPVSGTLDQKSGSAGCLSDGGTGRCGEGRALEEPRGVAVSPDGKNVYVASEDSRSVAVFDRDPATGVLRQKEGPTGCISSDPKQRSCARNDAVRYGSSVTVSPDGKSVYVASLSGHYYKGLVAAFDRDSVTGALTPPALAPACMSPDPSESTCLTVPALRSPWRVVVSPDGRSVYVDSYSANAIAMLARDPATGQLTPQGSAFACRTGGKQGCQNLAATFGAIGELVISPDGKDAYLSSINGLIGLFDRDPGSGVLTQKPGASGCISAARSKRGCLPGRAFGEPEGIAISPDGSNVYVSSYTSPRLTIFDRDKATGALMQKPGQAGCVSADRRRGCGKGRAFAGSTSLAVSPDGKNVYVASAAASSVAVFDRLTR